MESKYKYLDFKERTQISAWYLSGDRAADIAERLGVTPATIYRELKRGDTGTKGQFIGSTCPGTIPATLYRSIHEHINDPAIFGKHKDEIALLGKVAPFQ